MLKNKTGQMSIMLIVAIAIGLVFLSVTMNWNRIVQAKTQTQVAATSTAAYLVSQMASYGQSKIETELGGKAKVCNYTGVLSALITLIVIIIVIVVSVYVPFGGQTLWAGMTTAQATMLVASAVLATATLVIQITIIQPAITRMWNKMQQNIKTTEDRFMESALQSGLQGSISDSETIPDYLDMDMDGRWNVPDLGPNSKTTDDMIPRFTYWYTKRLLKYSTSGGTPNYDAFRTSVTNLANTLGIKETDEDCCNPPVSGGPAVNFCNEKCNIRELFLPSGDPYDPPETNTTILDGCETSPYVGYPYSYDPLFCARKAGLGLVGFLGRDDISKALHKTGSAHDPASPEEVGGLGSFQGRDSEGPLFRTLWFMRDTAPQVDMIDDPVGLPDQITNPAGMNFTSMNVKSYTRDCFWCNTSAPGVGACQAPAGNGYFVDDGPNSVVNTAGNYNQLTYDSLGSCFGADCCVAKFLNTTDLSVATVANIDPHVIDHVGAIKALNKVDDANVCPGNGGLNRWRAGSDLFCSNNTSYPHYMLCPAHYAACNVNPWSLEVPNVATEEACNCAGAASKDLWNEDEFDDTYVKLREIANRIQAIIHDTSGRLAASLPDIEEDVKETLDDVITIGGRLREWRDAMISWRDGTGPNNYRDSTSWCLSSGDTSAGAATSITVAEPGGIDVLYDFNDMTKSPYDDVWWVVSKSFGGIVEHVNHRIEMEYPAATRFGAQMLFQAGITGPFEVSVDYEILTPPASIQGLRFYMTADLNTYVQRAIHPSFGNAHGSRLPPPAGFTTVPVTNADMFGKFKISRDAANMVRTYYYDTVGDVWVLIKEQLDPSPGKADIRFGLIWNNQSIPGMRVAFDNFHLKALSTPQFLNAVGEQAAVPAGEGIPSVIACEKYYAKASDYFDPCIEALRYCATQLQDNPAADPAALSTNITNACTRTPRSVYTVLPKPFLPGLIPACTLANMSNVTSYKHKVVQAARLAVWQQYKFKKRAAYLQELYDRVAGGGVWPSLIGKLNDYANVIGTLSGACNMSGSFEQRLACFQGDGSVADIWAKFQAAKNETLTAPANLGPSVIYGWKSAPVAGMDPSLASDHLIRVDVALPKRCGWWEDARGGIDKSCGTNKFPWVKTKKKGSFKRCYFITDTDGCVKVRISRYDSDSTNSGVNGFGGLAKIWKFLYRHPEYMDDAGSSVSDCWSLNPAAYADIGAVSPSPYLVPYSFMLDKPGSGAATPQEEACRQQALVALKQGFFTEVCAKYFLVGNKYDIKFIPCRSTSTCSAL